MTVTNKNIEFKIRAIQLKDAKSIFSIIERDRQYLKEWLPFINFTRKIEDTEAFIRLVTSKNTEFNEVSVIVCGDEIAGIISYKDWDKFNHKIEIGYWIAKNHQGKGLVTGACKILIKNAFDFMGMNRVQIKVAANNIKSAAIPKRLNFKFEGIEREGEFLNGNYVDLEVYSLLKQEWINNNAVNEAH